MLNILSSIKSKTLPILLGLVGIMAVVIQSLRGDKERLKREAVEQDLEDEKAAREQANRATEALIRGVEDEQTNTNPRSYDFHD
jgi:hypothetical protein